MTRLALLAATAIALFAPTASHATYFVSKNGIAPNFASSAGASASAVTTTASLGSLFAPITSVPLANGTTITLSGTQDVVDQPGVGVAPFGNGYTGQVVDSTGSSETLAFSAPIANFGLTIQPDIGLFATGTTSYLFSLSDGTSVAGNLNLNSGDVIFYGFTNEPVTSLTISTSAPDFSFGQFLTVPEPTTALLLGSVLIPLLRRRRAA